MAPRIASYSDYPFRWQRTVQNQSFFLRDCLLAFFYHSMGEKTGGVSLPKNVLHVKTVLSFSQSSVF